MIKKQRLMKIMTEIEYNKITHNIVIPLANEIMSSQNNNLYHLIKLKKEFDNKLLIEINKMTSYIKNSIVITSEMDRHKICACLAYAIIKYSPFTISKKGYSLENLFFANELLGIYSAISLLECYNQNIKIIFPHTYYTANNIDPYIKTLCTSLYVSKNNKHLKYNILNLANILFLLESYSKEKDTQ